MQATLAVCRELNNAALQERREAWSSHRKGMLRRAVEATPRHQSRPRGRSCGSQSSSARCAAPDGQDFSGLFSSLPAWTSTGVSSLSKIGDIKIKLHRAIQGQIKTLSLKRENGMWYACFSCIVEPEPLPANDKAVGLDVGLLSFVTRSDGRRIGNPRLFPKAQKRLRRAQRRVARREKFSKRWKKAVRLVARIHRKVFNQRNDFQHKLSRKIVNSYGIIFVEDLNVKGLSRGRLAKSVHDAGWAAFFRKLSYKAESAGRRFASVDPLGTSQALPVWRSKSQTAFGS